VQQLVEKKVIELFPVPLKLAQRAAAIAAGHRLRGCNAIYVAPAEHLNDYLITLDRQQLEGGSKIIPTPTPKI